MELQPRKAPGFVKYPNHSIAISPAGHRWQASHGDRVLADSAGALALKESGYPPAIYFPATDVALEQLKPVDGTTRCPFKGEASYFGLAAGDSDDRVAWVYPSTYSEVADIAGYVAFYADRVDVRPLNND